MLDLTELQRPRPAPDPSWSGDGGARHRLVRLDNELVLLEAACDVPPPPGTATLTVEGRAMPPPTAALLLGGAATARLFFTARDAEGLLRPGVRCELSRDGIGLASFALAPPVSAGSALSGRTPEESRALLRFLAVTCAPLLKAGGGSDFARVCLSLARAVARDAPDEAATPLGPARLLCRSGATLSLLGVPDASAGAWHLLDAGGVRRVGASSEGVLAVAGPPPRADALLLPPGAAAHPILIARPAAGLLSLRDMLRRTMAGEAGGDARVLRALGPTTEGGRWAGLLQEVQLLAPARPRRQADPVSPVGGAIELALADGAGGLFLCGWVRDPLDLVGGLELRSAIARRTVPTGALHRVARPELAKAFAGAGFGQGGPMPGFVAHLPGADHAAVGQWRLALTLGSGEAVGLVAPPSRMAPAAARDLVLRAVHPAALRPGLLESCIAPAAWHLHRAAMAESGRPEVIRIGGAPPRRPRAAIVVPLYRNLRFLRFQLAAFARDAVLRGTAEIVYVLDSPEQRSEVEHLLRGMSALHGALPVTFVVMPINRGYASACNAGAAAAAAPVIGFLNSDVLPAARGWLAVLLGRLARDRRIAAVGPKLLFDDGAIQHAGLLFRRGVEGQWLNEHYFKGFPRTFAAACRPCRVPGVTGAALLVRRAAFEAAGAFCTDYVIGDFEDSDLCLALRAAGHEIGYEPAAELFHFERQSIADHSGHAHTLAGAYNRLLHHRRWDGAIEALMARFPDAAG